jgi:hypothetical protein
MGAWIRKSLYHHRICSCFSKELSSFEVAVANRLGQLGYDKACLANHRTNPIPSRTRAAKRVQPLRLETDSKGQAWREPEVFHEKPKSLEAETRRYYRHRSFYFVGRRNIVYRQEPPHTTEESEVSK